MTESNETEQTQTFEINNAITVTDLAQRVGANPVEVIKNLMRMGIMASLNDAIDFEVASPIAQFYGYTIKLKSSESDSPQTAAASDSSNESEGQEARSPVVTVLGHVDHGKTSILDALRKTTIADREAGGITQHIGAYQFSASSGNNITFLDTPGHEAFTTLRARGARVTDIAILVVSADDGVMPQTLEAIDHAKAADVPLVVAINKIDLPDADPERIKRQLSEQELLVEDWGGDVLSVEVSAKTGQGLEDLMESTLLLAEILELKANPNSLVHGTVIEAELNAQKGPLATVLIQSGTLKIGDNILVGNVWGRVRAMTNHLGEAIGEAPPSTPVRVLGLPEVPQPGEILEQVETEKEAKIISAERIEKDQPSSTQPASLEQLANQIGMGEIEDVNIIIKADVQGSLEAVRGSVQKANSESARANILHSDVGSITESDVLLATASGATIMGFNSRVESAALRLANNRGIEVRNYTTIYQLIDDLSNTLKGMVSPLLEEVNQGQAEIKEIFTINKIKIAGCVVTEGVIRKDSMARIIRQKETIFEGPIMSLRHFRDEVKEVITGQECGIALTEFGEFVEGDFISTFTQEEKAR
ncbi:MAG: translation initiation factor IF-2 [Chloroflexota bacterium]|nr:translation initiation factor IF-2 [Chloroflexota bacterium]